MDEMVEVFEHEGGFGYRVGGVVQWFHPDLPGFVSMTADEAKEYGLVVAARIWTALPGSE